MARASHYLRPSTWALCALLWTVSPACSAPPERQEEWNYWKTTHGRLYGSGQEDSERHSIWLDNTLYIEEHNVNAEKHGFTLKMNAFGDLTEEEWSQSQRCHKVAYMNESRNFTTSSKEEPCRSLSAEGELPESLDWREHYVVSDVKDQEEYRCHSCYAFAATGAIESAMALLTGSVVPLSEQQIIDCSRVYANAACRGGNYKFAWTYIMDIGGIDTAEAYPYMSMEGLCKYESKYASGAKVVGMKFVEKGNEEELKVMVTSSGPVAVAFDHRRRSFQFYSQGIYSDQSCSSYPSYLTHEMLVIGYNTSNNNVPYWIVKNSYGKYWGQGGYMLVRRNVNMCGIATEAAAPIVSLNAPSS